MILYLTFWTAMTLLGFIAVHLLVYSTDVSAIPTAFNKWWTFIMNPGASLGPASSWWNIFQRYFSGCIIVVLLLLGMTFHLRKELCGVASYLSLIYCFFGVVCYFSFLVKYPAISSLFDGIHSIILFLIVWVTCLGMNKDLAKWMGVIFLVSSVSFILIFDKEIWQRYLCESNNSSTRMIANIEQIKKDSRGEHVIVIIPNNSYHHEGYFEFLMKAASDFPTWYITKGKETVLDHYWPKLEFRTDFSSVDSGLNPDSVYPDRCVIIWVSSPDFLELPAKYHNMDIAVKKARKVDIFHEYPKGRSPVFDMHVAYIIPE